MLPQLSQEHCLRAGSDAPRPRATRRLAPDSLKNLLPPLMDDKVYLKWKSADSKVQVEFIGVRALMGICFFW